MKKKGQGLSITTIIVAVIALIVLVVLIAIFTGRVNIFERVVNNSSVEIPKENWVCIPDVDFDGWPDEDRAIDNSGELHYFLRAGNYSAMICIPKNSTLMFERGVENESG